MDDKSRGLSARVQGKKIYIGNIDYLKANGITPPTPNHSKIEQGFSAVYVAENGAYQGVIYVKHEIRPGIPEALIRLKKEGKKIIMLTGDHAISAHGFNRQLNNIFKQKDIHASQTPQDKEAFLKNLLSQKNVNPKGVWFIGDGLNDAPCCRVISEKGGVSCAMDSQDKSAFFTDITLNGSLDYLFKHHRLNRLLQQNITQNKGILIYSTLAFLAFIISFSIAGIAVSPFIPMAIMLSTTLFVLFNAYRTQLHVDIALDKTCPWYKKLLGSDFSIGLVLTASTLFIGATLTATITTGTLMLPLVAFTSGMLLACSSFSALSAIALLATFVTLLSASLCFKPSPQTRHQNTSKTTLSEKAPTKSMPYRTMENHADHFFLKRIQLSKNMPIEIAEEENNTCVSYQNFNDESCSVGQPAIR
jgi:Cu+-exporting ATPase